jgi:hypothetical protein
MIADIYPWTDDILTLGYSAALTLLAALLTVILSVPLGASLAFRASQTARYGTMLALLFVPFAIGSSVWAYSVSRLASWYRIQEHLALAGTWIRFLTLLGLCLGRALPLGVFFCATTLHRYTAQLRPYFRTHQLELPFFLICAFNRIPKSILMLLGLFGGALMASEASLPTFLYRANPGTGPETANIILSRVFREMYGNGGPEVLSQVAILGILVSLVLIISALIGTLLGRIMLRLAAECLGRRRLFVGKGAAMLSGVLRTSTILCLLPGICGIVGLVVPTRILALGGTDILDRVLGYRGILSVGVFVGVFIVMVSLAVAIRLRYGHRDLLALVENKPTVSCLLMLPAFLPILSVVAGLAKLAHGQTSALSGISALILCHIGLHYSVIQFICMALVAAIPEHHVAWQRAIRIRYSFSLITDGLRRHLAVLVGLVGLCTVQVVTDGSISRWFSYIVKSPEEALYASVLGRLANSAEAAMIAWSVGGVAIVVCGVLATAYVRELRNRPRYA